MATLRISKTKEHGERVCVRETGLCVTAASVSALADRKVQGDWTESSYKAASSEARAERQSINTEIHAQNASSACSTGPGRPASCCTGCKSGSK